MIVWVCTVGVVANPYRIYHVGMDVFSYGEGHSAFIKRAGHVYSLGLSLLKHSILDTYVGIVSAMG